MHSKNTKQHQSPRHLSFSQNNVDFIGLPPPVNDPQLLASSTGGSRLFLPTISSARNVLLHHGATTTATTTSASSPIRPSEVTSGDVGIPPLVEQIQKLTPRERVKLEFNLHHRAGNTGRPSHLFGSTFEKEAEKRRAVESAHGMKNEQMLKKLERAESRQSMRLSRSNLALSMSLAVEKGEETKTVSAADKRPSAWVKNDAGADRHKFQINWPDRSGAPMPSVPQKWGAPGPGSYGGSRLYQQYDEKMLAAALAETAAEKKKSKKDVKITSALKH